MASDGPIPFKCSDDVCRDGTLIFVTYPIPFSIMKSWVEQVAKKSGQRVDWHLVGGRACIKALGDIEAVKKAMRKLMDVHDAQFIKAFKNSSLSHPIRPPRPEWW